MGYVATLLHVAEGREGCTVYRSIQKNVSFTRGMGQQLTQTHSSGIREGRAQEREAFERVHHCLTLVCATLSAHPTAGRRVLRSNWVFRPSHRRIGEILRA